MTSLIDPDRFTGTYVFVEWLLVCVFFTKVTSRLWNNGRTFNKLGLEQKCVKFCNRHFQKWFLEERFYILIQISPMCNWQQASIRSGNGLGNGVLLLAYSTKIPHHRQATTLGSRNWPTQHSGSPAWNAPKMIRHATLSIHAAQNVVDSPRLQKKASVTFISLAVYQNCKF